MQRYRLGRKRILDIQLAAIFWTAGVCQVRAANPADFQIFDFQLLTLWRLVRAVERPAAFPAELALVKTDVGAIHLVSIWQAIPIGSRRADEAPFRPFLRREFRRL